MKKYMLLINLFLFLFTAILCAQNKYEEVIKYEEVDGMVVFPATVNGKTFKFIFDPMSLPLVLDDDIEAIGMSKNNTKMTFKWLDSEVVSGGSIQKLNIGKTIFIEKIGALSIKSEYLKKHGITGVINAAPFVGYVVTIDSKNKAFTVSTPYKPQYISLKNKADLKNKLQATYISIGQNEIDVNLDFVGNKLDLKLSAADAQKSGIVKNTDSKEISLPSVTLANNTITNAKTSISATDSTSSIGTGILKRGILSLDFVKARLYFQKYENIDQDKLVTTEVVNNSPIEFKDDEIGILNRMNFIDYIFDYKSSNEWKYKGDKPAIIDFWAEWCGPCKRIGKSLEELVADYAGKVRIFKVNFDEEPEIAKYFKVQSLPTLLYIPMEGEPQVIIGATSKESIIKNINTILLKNNK